MARKGKANLMTWRDHKKAYDFDPHNWINEYLELFGNADNVRFFFGEEYEAMEVVADV